MTETTVVAASTAVDVEHFVHPKSGVLTLHSVAAFRVAGEVATPIFYPPPPKGAVRVELEADGTFSAAGLNRASPQMIASAIRQGVSE
ncbi:hypothetical protein [Allochromatium palmeri]|uniref:Uncharacterized protein n=1 Tax=Allochromatium palmeri TaxID=231048 RepID=A0A6N8EEY4_9GAMM|nr:hypothetical protein [Allochromatium palmeri]MTW22805.1 hypothetical protein [Allochromatium palmeri]